MIIIVIIFYYYFNSALQDGTTALHWAAKTTLLRCVERLLELGASVNAADKVATPFSLIMIIIILIIIIIIIN